MEGFSPKQTARLTSLSMAMIGYLCREGFVSPTLSGARTRGRVRRFSYTDLIMMRTLAALLRKGVEIRRLKQSLQVLRKKYAELAPSRLPYRFLATNGVDVFEIGETQQVLRLDYSSQYEFCFVIDLKPIETSLAEDIAKMGKGAA